MRVIYDRIFILGELSKYIFKAYLIYFPQKTEHISQKCTPADTYLIEIYLKYYSMDF